MKARSDSDLPDDVDEFYDKEEEKKHLAKLKLPFLLAAFQKGIDMANRTGPRQVLPEDVWNANVRAAIESRNLEMAAKAVQTTEDALRKAMLDARSEGLGVRGLAAKINDLYGESMGYRSLRIARTELTGPINDGAMRTYQEQGYAEKTWSTVMDGHEREAHGDANGQTVPINEPFQVGGAEAMYPGDPSLPIELLANCRCVLQPSGSTDESLARRQKRNDIFLRAHDMLERRMVLALRGEFTAQRERVLARLGTHGIVI